ncbi:MAG: ribonuclease D [bacterium]|nr:ribonuclease D [bacterium]
MSPRTHQPFEAYVADFERIETQSELEALSRDLMKQKVVAFDTEADSFYHYFDKTCLVQVATKKRIALIDPLALGGPAELQPLAPVMASPDIRKIFHAAEYDLFVLKRDCGFVFANLFDTMISAQLLGYPAIGLSALIERHFGIKLPKDEQRSDWSARPLRDSQLTYAAADVTHLIQVTKLLEKELKKAGRLDWAHEEFETLTQRKWPEREFDRLGYLRIKGARALDPKSLSVLREMFLVRDKRAREIDRPPFKVLGNRALLEIAERKPKTDAALSKVKGVTDLILRRFGPEILAAVARGAEKNHGPVPKKAATNGPVRRRMDRATEKRVAALKRWRTGRAKELEMDPGVLCPNATLENIAWAEPKEGSDLEGLTGVKGWFARNFGSEIVAALGDE